MSQGFTLIIGCSCIALHPEIAIINYNSVRFSRSTRHLGISTYFIYHA